MSKFNRTELENRAERENFLNSDLGKFAKASDGTKYKKTLSNMLDSWGPAYIDENTEISHNVVGIDGILSILKSNNEKQPNAAYKAIAENLEDYFSMFCIGNGMEPDAAMKFYSGVVTAKDSADMQRMRQRFLGTILDGDPKRRAANIAAMRQNFMDHLPEYKDHIDQAMQEDPANAMKLLNAVSGPISLCRGTEVDTNFAFTQLIPMAGSCQKIRENYNAIVTAPATADIKAPLKKITSAAWLIDESTHSSQQHRTDNRSINQKYINNSFGGLLSDLQNNHKKNIFGRPKDNTQKYQDVIDNLRAAMNAESTNHPTKDAYDKLATVCKIYLDKRTPGSENGQTRYTLVQRVMDIVTAKGGVPSLVKESADKKAADVQKLSFKDLDGKPGKQNAGRSNLKPSVNMKPMEHQSKARAVC